MGNRLTPKIEWPFDDDEWIAVSSTGNPRAVHRMRKWANGLVDVACGSLSSVLPGRRFVLSKSDHERGDWSEVLRLSRCTRCWPVD